MPVVKEPGESSPYEKVLQRFPGLVDVQEFTGSTSLGAILAIPIVVLFFVAGILAFYWLRQQKREMLLPGAAAPQSRSVRPRSFSSASLPSRGSLVKGDGLLPASLCPELVVAPHVECVFAVPLLQMHITTQEGMVLRDITNKMGEPLLRLALTRVPTDHPRSVQSEYVMLTRLDETELAFCELEVTRRGTVAQCSVYCTTGDVFARVHQEEGASSGGLKSFIVTGMSENSPWQIRFSGDFIKHKIDAVVMETGKLVAAMSSGEEMPMASSGKFDHYQARLGPTADGALILISLLAIDRMMALGGQPMQAGTSNLGSTSSDLASEKPRN